MLVPKLVTVVALETARRFTFRYGWIVANAPRQSGIYALYRGAELLCIDDADSIFSALLNYWDQRKDSADLEIPTSFAFEVCAPEKRYLRLTQLVFRHRPSQTGHTELMARER